MVAPVETISSSSTRRAIEFFTVLKLVSIPPNQRWSTYGQLHRVASSRTIFPACRLVPTNRILRRSAVTLPRKFKASRNIGKVFSKLIMWILLRAPKMYGPILGDQNRVWWPKCTPASSIWRIETSVIICSLWVVVQCGRERRPRNSVSGHPGAHGRDCTRIRAQYSTPGALSVPPRPGWQPHPLDYEAKTPVRLESSHTHQDNYGYSS